MKIETTKPWRETDIIEEGNKLILPTSSEFFYFYVIHAKRQ